MPISEHEKESYTPPLYVSYIKYNIDGLVFGAETTLILISFNKAYEFLFVPLTVNLIFATLFSLTADALVWISCVKIVV